jgi:hypothetical protein
MLITGLFLIRRIMGFDNEVLPATRRPTGQIREHNMHPEATSNNQSLQVTGNRLKSWMPYHIIV